MKKKGLLYICAVAMVLWHCAAAAPVLAVDYSFIKKVEPLRYDPQVQAELQEEDEIAQGKPDTNWYDPLDKKESYSLKTEQQLYGLAELVNTRELEWQVNEVHDFEGITINLDKDIELTREWTPIGADDAHAFKGIFNGNGHTISGLSIKDSGDDNQGFFGYLNGTVQDLTVSGKISTKGSKAGGLVANLSAGAVVEHCTADVSIRGKGKIGGLVGESISGRIFRCQNNGDVAGAFKVGGIVGENWNGTVEQCGNSGDIRSDEKNVGTYGTGGVAGRSVAKDARIRECYNTGRISSANECVGGVVGYTNTAGSTIDSCYNTGPVAGPQNGDYGYAGGIVGSIGENGVQLMNSYNTGQVTNSRYIGGVLGNYTADIYDELSDHIRNNYYLNSSASDAVGKEKEKRGKHTYAESAAVRSDSDLRGTRMADLLGNVFRADSGNIYGSGNNGYPVLNWQQEQEQEQQQQEQPGTDKGNEEADAAKADPLAKMPIPYKEQIGTFLQENPYGTDAGELLIGIFSPQGFYDLSLEQWQEAQAPKNGAAAKADEDATAAPDVQATEEAPPVTPVSDGAKALSKVNDQ